MRHFAFIFLLLINFFSCAKKETFLPRNFSAIEINTILSDSLMSIRAIEILDDGSLAFAANNGAFGLFNPLKESWLISKQPYDSLNLHFRAVAHTSTDFFMLSIENPALLYKTGDSGQMQLVYEEKGEGVFYDAMTFLNDKEGIALGDSVNGCLSVIMTNDGGQTWKKLPCESLPKAEEGEGAFAASNTNIKVIGNKIWLVTTAGNIYFSENKGGSWDVIKTPIIKEKSTEGIYSIDFYDDLNGFAIGGDFTKPNDNSANKIVTVDGGKNWKLVGENTDPGYRSCVQYIPNRKGKEMIAIGFKGIDFSNDSGYNWKHLSDEGFYTIRFLNDTVAYAAGSGRISKLLFKEE